MWKRTKYIVGLAIWLCAALCSAQVLSVDEAVKIALKNNYDIHLSESLQQINTLNYNASQHAYLPTLNIAGSDIQEFNSLHQQYSNGNEVNTNGAASNSLSLGLEARLPLFNGLQLYAQKNKLEALLYQGENNLNAQIENTIAQVELGYYRIISEKNYLETLTEIIAIAQQRLQIAQAKKDRGLTDITEVNLAQIELNNATQAVQQQQLIIAQLMADLNTAMRIGADSIFQMTDTILLNTNLDYETLKAAIAQNPDYVALNYAIGAAQWNQKVLNAARLPQLNMVGGYNYVINKSDAGFFLTNQNYGPYVGVTLNIPIYNAGIYKNQTEVARIGTETIQIQQQQLAAQLESDLYKTWIAYTSAIMQFQNEKQNTELAQNNLDLELKRYELRIATIIELNDAEQNFRESTYKYFNLLYAAKASEIELMRLTGMLR